MFRQRHILRLTCPRRSRDQRGRLKARADAARGSRDDQFLGKYQESVVAVWSPTARASGFVVDSRGRLPGRGAHIHPGVAGVNGGVVVNTGLSAAAPLVMADGSANVTISNIALTQDLATQIMANPAAFYFNFHTPLNPGGAIRGQLARVQ